MPAWSIQSLLLDLKYTWKISRNASTFKNNFIIHIDHDGAKGMGEVAPNIRYQETPETINAAFEKFKQSPCVEQTSIEKFSAELNKLALPNALRFGIESAFIHWYCNHQHIAIESLLGVQKPGPTATSFSLPIMDIDEVETFYRENHLQRFSYIKLKVNAENGTGLLQKFSSFSSQPLIVDANEAWTDPDALIRFLETLKPYNIILIEQPMPSGMDDAYTEVKKHTPFPLMADESICKDADFNKLKKQFHYVNMKLMKAGGYINGIRLLNEARKHGMKTMIGCMVETTLGISSALRLCHGVDLVDLDGFLIVKDEPFNLVKEEQGKIFFS